ncbi:hypothetical protein [Pseudomonas sp. ADAK13]|uniref:hypothetical protein n=1 Tax=Pseudomonas sp. ADAK13 TaxID=2730847 RepID=UPI0014635D4C|nr:hypothetical protein [Pseudomonas sp. ADAK13]QJI35734.1 hypothetical protein HKK54_15375 [Pseudomonas sp. ADAK13]
MMIGSVFHTQNLIQALQPVQPVQPASKPKEEPSRDGFNQQHAQSNGGSLSNLGNGKLP